MATTKIVVTIDHGESTDISAATHAIKNALWDAVDNNELEDVDGIDVRQEGTTS